MQTINLQTLLERYGIDVFLPAFLVSATMFVARKFYPTMGKQRDFAIRTALSVVFYAVYVLISEKDAASIVEKSASILGASYLIFSPVKQSNKKTDKTNDNRKTDEIDESTNFDKTDAERDSSAVEVEVCLEIGAGDKPSALADESNEVFQTLNGESDNGSRARKPNGEDIKITSDDETNSKR